MLVRSEVPSYWLLVGHWLQLSLIERFVVVVVAMKSLVGILLSKIWTFRKLRLIDR